MLHIECQTANMTASLVLNPLARSLLNKNCVLVNLVNTFTKKHLDRAKCTCFNRQIGLQQIKCHRSFSVSNPKLDQTMRVMVSLNR